MMKFVLEQGAAKLPPDSNELARIREALYFSTRSNVETAKFLIEECGAARMMSDDYFSLQLLMSGDLESIEYLHEKIKICTFTNTMFPLVIQSGSVRLLRWWLQKGFQIDLTKVTEVDLDRLMRSSRDAIAVLELLSSVNAERVADIFSTAGFASTWIHSPNVLKFLQEISSLPSRLYLDQFYYSTRYYTLPTIKYLIHHFGMKLLPAPLPQSQMRKMRKDVLEYLLLNGATIKEEIS